MTCDDVRHAIYVYLDDEFAAPEAEIFRRHLDACSSCQELAVREATFLTHVKDSLAPPDVPDAVRSRIEAALKAAPGVSANEGRRASWWTWVAAPVAVAAGVLIAVAAWNAVPLLTDEDATVRHAVAAHRTPMPSEVTGGEESVRRFVRANAPFAADVPLAQGAGLELIGARLTQVEGQIAVIYQYQKDGRRVSVLQASTPAMAAKFGNRRPAHRGHRHGYGVVTFGARGVHNAVVGELPEQEMVRLVPASYRP